MEVIKRFVLCGGQLVESEYGQFVKYSNYLKEISEAKIIYRCALEDKELLVKQIKDIVSFFKAMETDHGQEP